MSLVTGEITWDGPIVGILVGISQSLQRQLERTEIKPPPTIGMRALIDTGSSVTAFMPSVFQMLGIQRFGTLRICTPSTKRGEFFTADQFNVSVTLLSGMTTTCLPSVRAIASEDFDEDEEVQALIGRDILSHCHFAYHGPSRSYELAF